MQAGKEGEGGWADLLRESQEISVLASDLTGVILTEQSVRKSL